MKTITDEYMQPMITRTNPAYIIARVSITDSARYQKYLDAIPPIIEKYWGKAIVRSAAPITLEGPEEIRRIVILEFPGVVMAKEFYASPEYREAKKFREDAAIGELVVVEGIAA